MTVLYFFLVGVHLIACFVLIAVILLQAGRGGGLVESINISDSVFGTKTSSFLQKATTVCAIVFMLTCLALAFVTAQQGKSLMDRKRGLEKMIPLPTETESSTSKVDIVPPKQETTKENSVEVQTNNEVKPQEKVPAQSK